MPEGTWTLPLSLALFLLVVGGGGAWLYHQVRAVETQLLIDDISSIIEPLVEKLAVVDAGEDPDYLPAA